LANRLESDSNTKFTKSLDLFKVEIGLTEKGEKEYKDIIKTVYMYINEIKKEGVKDFLY